MAGLIVVGWVVAACSGSAAPPPGSTASSVEPTPADTAPAGPDTGDPAAGVQIGPPYVIAPMTGEAADALRRVQAKVNEGSLVGGRDVSRHGVVIGYVFAFGLPAGRDR